MKNIILEEIKSFFILKSHQCYKDILECDNQIKIIKSEYVGSSTIEVVELVNTYEILKTYTKYLDILMKEDGIVVVFK